MKTAVHLLLAGLLLLTFAASAGAEEAPSAFQKRVDSSQKKLIGENVPAFGALAADTTKGLLYVIAPLLLCAAAYRRYGQKGFKGVDNKISIQSRRSIGAKTALLLVEVEGSRFLLAQTADDVKLLSTVEAPAEFHEILLDLDEEEGINKMLHSSVVHG